MVYKWLLGGPPCKRTNKEKLPLRIHWKPTSALSQNGAHIILASLKTAPLLFRVPTLPHWSWIQHAGPLPSCTVSLQCIYTYTSAEIITNAELICSKVGTRFGHTDAHNQERGRGSLREMGPPGSYSGRGRGLSGVEHVWTRLARYAGMRVQKQFHRCLLWDLHGFFYNQCSLALRVLPVSDSTARMNVPSYTQYIFPFLHDNINFNRDRSKKAVTMTQFLLYICHFLINNFFYIYIYQVALLFMKSSDFLVSFLGQ